MISVVDILGVEILEDKNTKCMVTWINIALVTLLSKAAVTLQE